jgi:hypothetical protein
MNSLFRAFEVMELNEPGRINEAHPVPIFHQGLPSLPNIHHALLMPRDKLKLLAC